MPCTLKQLSFEWCSATEVAMILRKKERRLLPHLETLAGICVFQKFQKTAYIFTIVSFTKDIPGSLYLYRQTFCIDMNDEEFYGHAKEYWAGVSPTVDGMLGGFAHVSSTDVGESNKFLRPYIRVRWQFHQPRLVIRTFHRQGRCSRGGHLCNEHSEEKYSCSYK